MKFFIKILSIKKILRASKEQAIDKEIHMNGSNTTLEYMSSRSSNFNVYSGNYLVL